MQNMKKVRVDRLNALGKLRESSNLSRKDVVKKVVDSGFRCTEAHLCQIEKQGTKRKPSLDLAKKLAELYRCSIDNFFPSFEKKKEAM
jgi:transcriptional regulator with XRE-family HTH domain